MIDGPTHQYPAVVAAATERILEMSRFFNMVHAQTWNNPLVKKMSVEANLLRLYLLSNHFANASGYYIFKAAYAAEDLPMSKPKVLRAMKELEEAGFIRYSPENYALLILDWFTHHGISSCTNAQHIMTLFKRKLVPQDEPELEAILFPMMANATIDRHENNNLGKFFDFLDDHAELPAVLAAAAQRYRDSLPEAKPAAEPENGFGQGVDQGGGTDNSGVPQNPFAGPF